MIRGDGNRTGSRVGLRHVTEVDLPFLIAAAGDPAIRGAHQNARMQSPAQIRKRFADNAFSTDEHEMLLICDEADRVIGTTVHFLAHRYSTAREIGWIVYDEAKRGQGYASEAAALLVDYLFGTRQEIHRLSCGMVPSNIASRRVAEKCGFTYEGRAREVLFVDGRHVDGEMFSLLRPEWAARRG